MLRFSRSLILHYLEDQVVRERKDGQDNEDKEEELKHKEETARPLDPRISSHVNPVISKERFIGKGTSF